MRTMVLSPAERARVHNRQERYGARHVIAAGLEEYLEQLEEQKRTLTARELLLHGIYPATGETMRSSFEFWVVIGALGLLTPFEKDVAHETAHYIDWMQSMMESWDEWMKQEAVV